MPFFMYLIAIATLMQVFVWCLDAQSSGVSSPHMWPTEVCQRLTRCNDPRKCCGRSLP